MKDVFDIKHILKYNEDNDVYMLVFPFNDINIYYNKRANMYFVNDTFLFTPFVKKIKVTSVKDINELNPGDIIITVNLNEELNKKIVNSVYNYRIVTNSKDKLSYIKVNGLNITYFDDASPKKIYKVEKCDL